MNHKILKSMCFLTASLIATSCISAKKSNKDTAETWNYELTDNNCSTGKQSFNSKKTYCEGLLNDRLNNNCAGRMRALKVEKECQEFTDAKPTETPDSEVLDSGENNPGDDTPTEDTASDVASLYNSINFSLKVNGSWSLAEWRNSNNLSARATGFADATTSSTYGSQECFKITDAKQSIKISGTCAHATLLGILNKSQSTIQIHMIDADNSSTCKSEAKAISQGESTTFELSEVPTCSGRVVKKLRLNIEK